MDGVEEHPAGAADSAKSSLDRETLRDVIGLALWAGQLLLQHGAEAQRVEETVHRLGTSLGCDWMDVYVDPNIIIVTTTSGDEFRTKARRIVRIGVNLSLVAAVNDLSRRVTAGKLDRHELREALEILDHTPPQYNRWLVIVMVGLACAAFSRLSGGDWPVFAVTFAAAAVAAFVRQELKKHHFNRFLVVAATAFVAGLIAALATTFAWSDRPEIALVSSVLLLVPGVPLINAAQDIIKGHRMMGLVRGVTSGLIALSIALGLLLAMWLMGIRNL